MRSVFIDNFESGEVSLRDVEDLRLPTAGEVLVEVKAAGLNRGDLLQARGKYPPPKGYSPHRPGLEFAGVIAAKGEGVNGFSVGDRVMGLAAGEAQAELLIAEASHLTKIPQHFSFAEAAAIPEAFITAHDALITQADLKAGENLLIHAVASGVGLAALQIGKAFGATVAGTSRSAEKLEKCLARGLDLAFDTGNSGFSESLLNVTDGKGADVILDLVGASYLSENLTALALKGRLMMVGLTGGRKAELDMGVMLQKRLTLRGTVLRSRSSAEKTAAVNAFANNIIPLFDELVLTPDLDRVYAFNDVSEAYGYLASDKSFGKVVLEW